MVRQPLSESERLRGAALGRALRAARGNRSMVAVAAEAGISAETLRKIERGAIATPAFFTIAALAQCLQVRLDELLARADAAIADPAA